jgi:hypothetical protein
MDEETANKYSLLKGINADVNPALNQMWISIVVNNIVCLV